jgi:CBS domain-containing protein
MRSYDEGCYDAAGRRDRSSPRESASRRREDDVFQRSYSNWGRSDYDKGRYGDRGSARRGQREDRDFLDRASDEMSSWFGDEQAAYRRQQDERMERQRRHGGRGNGASSRDPLREITVQNVMTRDVVTLMPDDMVEQASRLMRECDCGALPVVGWSGRVIGMITDRDIAVRLVGRGIDTRRARVSDCMSDEVFACHPWDAVDDCLRTMSRHQVRRLPIVDEDRRILGIVSQSDLARHAGDHPGQGERRAVADVVCAVSEPSRSAHR